MATDLDPQGDPPRENPELAPQAVDGDPATAWRSLTYKQNFGPSGLKTGLGLVVDLGESSDISEIQLRLLGKPTDVSIYISEVAPSDVEGLTPAATSTIGRRGTLTLDEPVAGQYVTVWLTSLPQVGSGFRGELAEIVVLGP